MVIDNYSEKGSGGIFGWGVSFVEACVGVSADIELSGSMTVSADELGALEGGVALRC